MSEPLPPSVYRQRRVAVAAGGVVVLLLAVLGVRAVVGADGDGAAEPTPSTTTVPGADGSPSTTTEPGRATSTTIPSLRFTLAGGGTGVVGTGPLQTYTVEVEEGTGVDVDEFAATVDAILADRRGWTTADGIALQRVSSGPATFTVRLATPASTDLLCLPLDTGGQVSCGQEQMAVLNLTRWQEGAAPSKLDLDAYRQYLVSHEVGHLLGHHHVECAGPGQRATTMMQQTLDLGACTPNPWPAPDA